MFPTIGVEPGVEDVLIHGVGKSPPIKKRPTRIWDVRGMPNIFKSCSNCEIQHPKVRPIISETMSSKFLCLAEDTPRGQWHRAHKKPLAMCAALTKGGPSQRTVKIAAAALQHVQPN